jgi:hypothetical protein
MASNQYLVDKTPIAAVYFSLDSRLDYIDFIASLGLKVDRNYPNYYIVVDEKKWSIARLKYGV